MEVYSLLTSTSNLGSQPVRSDEVTIVRWKHLVTQPNSSSPMSECACSAILERATSDKMSDSANQSSWPWGKSGGGTDEDGWNIKEEGEMWRVMTGVKQTHSFWLPDGLNQIWSDGSQCRVCAVQSVRSEPKEVCVRHAVCVQSHHQTAAPLQIRMCKKFRSQQQLCRRCPRRLWRARERRKAKSLQKRHGWEMKYFRQKPTGWLCSVQQGKKCVQQVSVCVHTLAHTAVATTWCEPPVQQKKIMCVDHLSLC